MLLERGLVRGALPVLLAVLADERLGRQVALQLRLAARVAVFGVALALRGRFGAIAHGEDWGCVDGRVEGCAAMMMRRRMVVNLVMWVES